MSDYFPAPKPFSLDGNISESWKRWLQQYELYMCATEKDKKSEKLQCATLLSLAGEQVIELVGTFNFGEEEKDKIEPLKQKLSEYCIPKKNETYERHVFNSRVQKSGETFDQFLTELKVLSKDCGFGNLKEGLIRDRIIEGIGKDQTRARLLRERELNLDKCIDLCRAAERTDVQMKGIVSENTTEKKSVDLIKKQSQKNPNQSSYKGKGPRVPKHNTSRCQKCGMDHKGSPCPAKEKTCYKCGKTGHYQKLCRTRTNFNNNNLKTKPKHQQKVHSVETDQQFFVDAVHDSNKTDDSWIVNIDVNGCAIPMKLDTGSDVNIMGIADFNRINKQCHKIRLHQSTVKLTAYNGGSVPTKGQCVLDIKYKGFTKKALFVIASSVVKPILGRKQCDSMGLVKRVLMVEKEDSVKSPDIFTEYKDLFEGLGCLADKVKIKLKPDAEPVVEPCRKVPFALHDQLKQELDRMEELQVIKPIEEPTEFVNSMVIVHKSNGKLRVCLDPRNLNRAICREHFKLPTREEIMAKFAGATVFSKLDASSGFWQLQLEEKSSKLCAFNTPYGRYRFLRLPFGISSAPEIFHRTIHLLYENMRGVDTSMDDIIVWGVDQADHDRNLRNVLDKTREAGLKLQREKCEISVPELTFLGDRVTKNGVKPDLEKVKAIQDMENPKCKNDIQHFLGMINYLARFIRDLSTHTALLRGVLDKKNCWEWTDVHQKSFENLKEIVSNSPVLQYYDPTKLIRISADASQKGLLQKHNTEWLPVAYASRALTDTESRYASIEREALAVVYACERFHQYVY
ncbi:uncharacterized protein K02A2.6-like [Ylistrum balloti]|uniref:uncharacterized protein K02A2.6-like n=1 Tax=Ylistrum balloti TaxID=509963 RepID=UPI002905F498|nr:uncharacterized protein K02A2.6-like [Ylistrum balloti]